MDGNSTTDDRFRLFDQFAGLRDRLDTLRRLFLEADWLPPLLDSAFWSLDRASQFARDLAGEIDEGSERAAGWRAVAETALDASPYPLLVTDANQYVEHANEAASVLFRRSSRRLKNLPITTLFRSDSLPTLTSGEQLADGGMRFEPTLSNQVADLKTMQVAVEVTPCLQARHASGRQRLLWCVHEPVDIEQFDRRLESLQKNAAIGRMATGITHEFKNILGIITTWCELGLRDENCPESVRTSLRKISHAANRGSTLTEGLLSYGLHDTSETTTFDVNDLLARNVDTLGALLPGRIEVELLPSDTPLEVTFDENHFEQILLNLVLNARDAISETGRITCQARPITLEQTNWQTEAAELPPGRYVEIAIEDTGCGMDAETLEEASSPFYSTKQEDGGTGLGLPTVVDLTSRGDGGVIIDSEPLEGTTVRVLLPRSGAD